MTSLQIKYFLKVADNLSFSRTAEEMFVAQSSVSRQVQLLEKEFGCELFDRSQHRSIRLTAAGIAFRDFFRHSMREFEQVSAMASQINSDIPLQIHIGIGQNWNLTPILRIFKQQVHDLYPQAKLTMENLPFQQLHHQLNSGSLDVIFCTRTSVQKFDDLEVLELGQLEGRAYVRKGLLCPEDEALQIEDFEGQTLLMLPEEEVPMAQQIVQLQFLAHQVTVHPKHINNRDSIHQALLMGDGFSVFDEHVWLGNDPNLTYYRLGEGIPICMVWAKSNRNPLIHMLAETAVHNI